MVDTISSADLRSNTIENTTANNAIATVQNENYKKNTTEPLMASALRGLRSVGRTKPFIDSDAYLGHDMLSHLTQHLQNAKAMLGNDSMMVPSYLGNQ